MQALVSEMNLAVKKIIILYVFKVVQRPHKSLLLDANSN